MKTAIQVGGGNIGRGFIGMLLSQAGYRVVFADVVPAVLDRLNADKCYTVHIMDTEIEDVRIENVSGISSATDALPEEIAKADTTILTTAVGLRILPIVAKSLAKGLQWRREKGIDVPLNVVACENAIRGTSQLKEHTYKLLSAEEQAWADEYVGFADCSVDRIVPPSALRTPSTWWWRSTASGTWRRPASRARFPPFPA